MYTLITRNKTVRILFAISFLSLTHFTLGQAEKEAAGDSAEKNQIVIKDFHFTPQTLTVKSGEKITWINRDEEPHTVVSVEKQFKKSGPLDTWRNAIRWLDEREVIHAISRKRPLPSSAPGKRGLV